MSSTDARAMCGGVEEGKYYSGGEQRARVERPERGLLLFQLS